MLYCVNVQKNFRKLNDIAYMWKMSTGNVISSAVVWKTSGWQMNPQYYNTTSAILMCSASAFRSLRAVTRTAPGCVRLAPGMCPRCIKNTLSATRAAWAVLQTHAECTLIHTTRGHHSRPSRPPCHRIITSNYPASSVTALTAWTQWAQPPAQSTQTVSDLVDPLNRYCIVAHIKWLIFGAGALFHDMHRTLGLSDHY